MRFKKITMLTILVACLLAVSAVSAAENVTDDVVSIQTTDEIVSVENDNQIMESVNDETDYLSDDSDGTFTDLANDIANATGELNLTKNYAFDYSKDSNYELGIKITKSITINGNGFVINGCNDARAFNVQSSNVIIRNIEFNRCGFWSMKATGGAVYWSGENGVLVNCSFVNNSVFGDLKPIYGGAVYWSGENGSIVNCSFLDNIAICDVGYYGYGGAVYWSGVNGIVSNCSFVSNSAYGGGGSVYWSGVNGSLVDCCFVNSCSNYFIESILDYLVTTGYGGAVYWDGVNGSVVNCSFINSCIYNSNYPSRNVGDYVSSCSFGGAVYWNGDNGVLVNCSFANSSFYSYVTDLYDYFSCTSSGFGGAVYWSGVNGSVVNCSFMNSSFYSYNYTSSSVDGGAVYWSGVNGSVVNCSFVNNSVFGDSYDIKFSGGAVYWSGFNGSVVNCSFLNYGSSSAHTVYWSANNGTLANCKFLNITKDNVFNKGSYFKFIKRNEGLVCSDYVFVYKHPENISLNLTVLENFPTNSDIELIIDNGNSSKYFITYIYNFAASFFDELYELDVGNCYVSFMSDVDDNYGSYGTIFIFTVLPASSSLAIDDVNATINQKINLVANVSSDLIINEGTVVFFDGETNIGESNVNNGTATLTYTPTTAGEHTITAIFTSGNHLSSNSTAKLLVDSATIDVLVNQGIVGFNSSFVAEVKGLYSTINEGNVKFYVDNNLIGSVPVVNGSASVNYIPLNANTYTVKAVFGDSDKFLGDEDSVSHVVLPADSSVAVGGMNGTVGHDVVIGVNITSSNNLTLNEGTVIFLDGQTQIGESPVSNGIATLTYTPTTSGEHKITAKFTSYNYQDSNNTAILSVAKAEINLSIENIATVYFSNPNNFAVNVFSSSKGVNEGNIKYYIYNQLIGTSDVISGASTLSYITHSADLFELEVIFEETDNYLASNASTTFNVIKMPTTLTGESIIFDEQSYKTFTTELKDNNTNGVNNQTVKIELIKYSGESATFTGISDTDGITVYDLGKLAGGMWHVAGTYNGNENYSESKLTDKFVVVRMATTTDIEEIVNPRVNHTYKLKANIHDENGKLVKEGIVHFYLDGVDIGSINLSNPNQKNNGVLGASLFEYKLGDDDSSDLYLEYIPSKVGKHALTAVYEGTTVYKASNQTTTFFVTEGIDPVITASDAKVTYNAGSYYKITIYGADGKLANGVSVVVIINGKSFKTIPTVDGVAKFKVTQKPGTYKLNITALGKTITKTLKVNHLLTLKKVTVKKSAKKLVLTATLGKVNKKYLKNKKVTFKFNGKKYTVKTDKKGVAKVTIKSSVLKKLKVGKKVIYQATYLKDTVKYNVKIKK